MSHRFNIVTMLNSCALGCSWPNLNFIFDTSVLFHLDSAMPVTRLPCSLCGLPHCWYMWHLVYSPHKPSIQVGAGGT